MNSEINKDLEIIPLAKKYKEIKIPIRTLPCERKGRKDYTFALKGENVYIADALQKFFECDFNTLFREWLSTAFEPKVEVHDDEVNIKLLVPINYNNFAHLALQNKNKLIQKYEEIKIPKRPTRYSGREDYTFALKDENVYIADALQKIFESNFNTLFRKLLSAQFEPKVEMHDDEVNIKLLIPINYNNLNPPPLQNKNEEKEICNTAEELTSNSTPETANGKNDAETDMQIYPVKAGAENKFDYIVDVIFAKNPIIGNSPELTKYKSLLIGRSKQILKKAIDEQNDITSYTDRSKLTLAIICFAFDWKLDNEENIEEPDENEEKGFWNYIAQRFEIEYSRDFYIIVTESIIKSISFHQRFFITENNENRYVSTILLHALAPEYNLFNFFNLIYDCQDILTSKSEICTLIDQFKALYNASKYHIRQGIQKLIKHRHEFSCKFTEEILVKIKDLFDGKVMSDGSRIDSLLNKWFANKVYLKRGKNSREISDSVAKINPKYIFKGDEIYLTIPDSQMKDVNNSYYLKIYLHDKVYETQELFTYGNNILEGKEINVSNLLHANPCSLNLKIEILSGGKTIFDSEKRLFREQILFRYGKEYPLKSSKPGDEYALFCPDKKADFNFEKCDYEFENYDIGKLFYLTLDEGFAIIKNGKIICSDNQSDKILVTPDTFCNEYAVFHKDGKNYKIFKKNFYLLVKNISSDSRAIIVTINDTFNLLSGYEFDEDEDNNRTYKISIPSGETQDDVIDQDTESGIYNISIKTLDGEEMFTDKLCIIQNFEIEFDKPYYTENALSGNVKIHSKKISEKIQIIQNANVECIYNGGIIEIYPPFVKWKITDNGNIKKPIEKNDVTLIWHKDISQHAILTITHPKTSSISIRLHNNLKRGKQKASFIAKHVSTEFDLGNISKSGIDKIDLCIYGKIIKTFYLRETFKNPPKFKTKGQSLYLENPEDFINKDDVPVWLHYHFMLADKKDISLKEKCLSNEKNIKEHIKIPSGFYEYSISIDNGEDEEYEIFGKSCIYRGECHLGEAYEEKASEKTEPPASKNRSEWDDKLRKYRERMGYGGSLSGKKSMENKSSSPENTIERIKNSGRYFNPRIKHKEKKEFRKKKGEWERYGTTPLKSDGLSEYRERMGYGGSLSGIKDV